MRKANLRLALQSVVLNPLQTGNHTQCSTRMQIKLFSSVFRYKAPLSRAGEEPLRNLRVGLGLCQRPDVLAFAALLWYLQQEVRRCSACIRSRAGKHVSKDARIVHPLFEILLLTGKR